MKTNRSIPSPDLVPTTMRNVYQRLVTLVVPAIWVLLHSVDATLVPESTHLPDHLDVFCPDVDVCPEKKTKDRNDTEPHRADDRVACCTACSCDDSCARTNDCCFPPAGLHPESECLYPTTKPPNGNVMYSQAFRMVVHDALKKLFKNTSEILCHKSAEKIPCGETQFSPFGSLLPVYSKQSNMIYKNPACAASHEVIDGVVWQPKIVCQSQTLAFIQTLEYGFLLSDCYVDFMYPGPRADLKAHTCYRDIKHACDSEPFLIPTRLNITASQVQYLCESGFVSPAHTDIEVYANVFCHICSKKPSRAYNISSKECHPDHAVGGRDSGKALSYLLNVDNFIKKEGAAHIAPEVCDVLFEKLNSSKCRKLKCPLNQLRDENGKCKCMTIKRPDTTNYIIVVKVSVIGFTISSSADGRQRLQELIGLWNGVNPWPRQVAMHCVLDSENSSVSAVSSLVVTVAMTQTRNMPFQTFLTNVEVIMNKKWTFQVNGSIVKIHQSFSEFSKLNVIREKTFGYLRAIPRYYDSLTQAELLALNITAPLILELRNTMVAMASTMYLNKMYYCQQIELQPHEFTLYTPGFHSNVFESEALYNKLTGRLMIENEFWLIRKPNGKSFTRICLSDSGYKKSGTGSMNVHMVLRTMLCWICLQVVK